MQVVDSRRIEQEATFDVVITSGLLDLVERTSHLTCPMIDVQHGVFMHATWQSWLVAAATRAHQLLGTTIVGFNEAVRQNFPEHARDDVMIIPNGSDPSRVHSLVDRDELKVLLGFSPEHKVVVYGGHKPAKRRSGRRKGRWRSWNRSGGFALKTAERRTACYMLWGWAGKRDRAI